VAAAAVIPNELRDLGHLAQPRSSRAQRGISGGQELEIRLQKFNTF
jgi:hypothetical protein